MGDFFSDFCFDKPLFKLNFFLGLKFEFPIMIVIFHSLPTMTQYFQQFLPSTIKTLQHIRSNFLQSPNNNGSLFIRMLVKLLLSIRNKLIHLSSHRIITVNVHFMVHVGWCSLKWVHILLILWWSLEVIYWVLILTGVREHYWVLIYPVEKLADLFDITLMLGVGMISEFFYCYFTYAFVLLGFYD